MFSFTDHDADDTLLSAPREGLDAEIAYTNSVRDVLRLSRQAEARAVIGAYTIGRQAHHDRITSSPHLTSRSQATAHKHAIGEISLQLGVTRTKAGQWSSLGEMLHDLPKIRLAYLAGDFSTHRVTELVTSAQIAPKGDLRQRIDAIIDASLTPHPTPDNSDPTADDDNTTDRDTHTEDAHADTDDADVNAEADTDADADAEVDDDRAPIDFEDIALELAYRPTTDTVLRDELDNTLITLDPDAHAAAREDVAQAFQNVTFAKEAFGHTNLSACLSAEHAVHLQQRIATLLDQRVCRRDPRRIGHRRADALAEIHGVPGAHLHCECGYDTCTAGARNAPAAASTGPAVDAADAAVQDPTGEQPAGDVDGAAVAGTEESRTEEVSDGEATGGELFAEESVVDEVSDDTASPPTPPEHHEDSRGHRAECRKPDVDDGADFDAIAILACSGDPAGGVITERSDPQSAGWSPVTRDLCRPSGTPRVTQMYLYRDRRCRHP